MYSWAHSEPKPRKNVQLPVFGSPSAISGRTIPTEEGACRRCRIQDDQRDQTLVLKVRYNLIETEDDIRTHPQRGPFQLKNLFALFLFSYPEIKLRNVKLFTRQGCMVAKYIQYLLVSSLSRDDGNEECSFNFHPFWEEWSRDSSKGSFCSFCSGTKSAQTWEEEI